MKHNGRTITLGLREGLEYFSNKYTPKEACTTSVSKEAKPVGEWIYEDKVVGKRYYRCSNCTGGYETLADEDEVKWWRFCPRCGSKMFIKEDKE